MRTIAQSLIFGE